MNDIVIYSATSLCAVYFMLTAILLFGLFRRSRSVNTPRVSVSIIVPARNEAANIDACLQALATQTYPDDLMEIIVVDDRSTDDTAARIDKWTRCLSNLSRVSVTQQNCACPKKKRPVAGHQTRAWRYCFYNRCRLSARPQLDCVNPPPLCTRHRHGHRPRPPLEKRKNPIGLAISPGTHRLNSGGG